MADPKKKPEDEDQDDQELELEASSDAEDADDATDPEKGIADLKASLEAQKKAFEEEKRLRAEAEQRAQEAAVAANQERAKAVAAQRQSVSDSLTFMKAREKGLVQEIAEAKSIGDYQKEAELQREMVTHVQAMERLQISQGQLEKLAKQPVQQVAPSPSSQLDQWISSQSPRTASWIRSNREAIGIDQEANRHLIAAAHHKAVGQGHVIESDSYFDAIDRELGLKDRGREEEEVSDEPISSAGRRSVAPPAAPVSRGGSRNGTFTLTSAEKEAAQISGVSYEEYYRNMMREKKRSRG